MVFALTTQNTKICEKPGAQKVQWTEAYPYHAI